MKNIACKSILSSVQALGLLAAMGAGSAHGATILIDWSSTTSITTGSDGKNWNSLGVNTVAGGDLTNSALIDSTGASTTVTVSVDTAAGSPHGWGNFDGTAGPDPFDEAAVYGDALFNGTNDQLVPITFEGLLANTQYTFTAINRRATNGRDGKITITTGTSANLGTGVIPLNGSVLSFEATTNASGVIALTFAEDTAGAGGALMNGMTITGTFAVPEPSSALLLGLLGTLGLLRRRRSA